MTITKANLLFLFSLLLVFIGSLLFPNIPAAWLLLLREFGFLLLPSLAFLAFLRLPIAATLRLRWPGGKVAVLSLLIGFGSWLFGLWLGNLVTELLGYSTPLPPDFYPTTVPKAILLLFALAVSAPLAEEILFRGIIQPAYYGLGPAVAITASSLLFIVFHQSLPQGLGIIPIAFVLGYVVWRSDSLIAGMLIHFIFNLLGASLVIASTFYPSLEIGPYVLPLAMSGLALALIGLWLLHRLTRGAAHPVVEPPAPGCVTWGLRLLPLILALPVYGISLGAEALIGLSPETLALGQPVKLPGAEEMPAAPARWRYEIRTRIDEPVGTAECNLSPSSQGQDLHCRWEQQAYEADTGQGVWYGGDTQGEFRASWSYPDLQLLSFEVTESISQTTRTVQTKSTAVPVIVQYSQDGTAPESLTLTPKPHESSLLPTAAAPAPLLAEQEMPWRLAGLPFSAFYAAGAEVLFPFKFDQAEDAIIPALDSATVIVMGAEPIAVPATKGSGQPQVAWKVQLDDRRTAWYAVDSPHTLLQYDNGLEFWVLLP